MALLLEVTHRSYSSLADRELFAAGVGGRTSVSTNLMLSETRTTLRLDFHFWKFSPVSTSLDKRAVIGFPIDIGFADKIRNIIKICLK